MGIADKLLKLLGLREEKPKTEINSDESFNILSAKGLIEYVEANLDNPSEDNVLKAVQAIAKPDEDQTHLTEDGDLPWGWLSKNAEFIEKHESKIYAASTKLKNMTIHEKKAALKKTIAAYYNFRNICYKKDECFKKYFSDMWENCHNAEDPSSIFITKYEEELKYIEENLESLLQQEAKKKEFESAVLPTLRNNLKTIIKNSPGIIQADLYKQFDPVAKTYIQYELYTMDKEGIVLREKAGKSYKLYYKGKKQR